MCSRKKFWGIRMHIIDQNSAVSLCIVYIYVIAVQRYEVVFSVLFKCGACPSGQVQHCASASASTLAGAPALDLAITSGGRHHCYFHGSSSSLSSSSTLIQHFVKILSTFILSTLFCRYISQHRRPILNIW